MLEWLKRMIVTTCADYDREVICACGDCPHRKTGGFCRKEMVFLNWRGECMEYEQSRKVVKEEK